MRHWHDAYALISKFYGDHRAHRSKQLYIKHIDEGLGILQERCPSINTSAMAAYCLHPMFQDDTELLRWRSDPATLRKIEPDWIVLCMEYRSVANAYLSPHLRKAPEQIGLSCISEVNEMLVADKVQNRKDFETYLKGHVENSDDLEYYFGAWLEALGVSEPEYLRLREVPAVQWIVKPNDASLKECPFI